MSLVVEQRMSDSSYVESITHGWTVSDGHTIRPAEVHWHLVLVKHCGQVHPLVVGPWVTAGAVSWGADAEILWIRFKLGTFMPHLPTRKFLETETVLPEATSRAFWLKSTAWQFPDYDNVETFIDRLVRDDVLVRDPVVNTVLQGQSHDLSPRTVRHRFLQATGLTQSHIFQFNRALRAEAMLQGGASILDTVDEAGYFDQPHLTRSLKRFTGKTPAQIVAERV
ncbi:MAG: AraC family transcriptional regulator [Anaerolineaceae bacterium]|nr:AraC family transcriptional regulator [Anaerolineaceae bacterium]